jgi:leader peptidase (prepilin peptidase)/N-methyltransferase
MQSFYVDLNRMGFWIALATGLVVGSFLNVIIYRVPKSMLSANDDAIIDTAFPILGCLVKPASTTPCCHVAIAWYDNIPLISWILLWGKCRYCGLPIMTRYVLVEIISGIAFAVTFLIFGQSWATIFYCLFFALLIALFWIDLETYFLPDCLTISLLWLGLFGAALGILTLTANEAILGALIAYIAIWSINFVYYLWRRRHGFGGGDFKLLAALGAWLGAGSIIPTLLIASILAILVISLLGVLKKEVLSLEKKIPFGPFLVLAGCFVFLMGNFRY